METAVRSPRKRSVWRGLCAGLVALLACAALAVLLLGAYLLTFFGFGPYDTGPIDPYSREWLLHQLLGLLWHTITGAAIARWSDKGSWDALVTFAAVIVGLESLGHLPLTASIHAPAGVLL